MNARDKKYDNDWYFWGLENIGGKQGGMYLSFANKTRTTEMSALRYIQWTKDVISVGYGGQIWEVNARKDAVKTMEKWLVLWNEKRAVEIPKELEAKRLEDIRIKEEKEKQRIIKEKIDEEKRLKELQNDKLLLDQVRLNYFQVDESRYLELLKQDYSDLENFVDSDDIETKPIEETKPIKETKPIEETTTPILLVLGVGLVSYYLLKGNKK